MALRAFKNLLYVIWVLVIVMFLIWPTGTQTWKLVHLTYFFYYFIIPALICWLAFLYLEYIGVKYSKIRAVAESAVAAVVMFMLASLSANWFLPKEYIAYEQMGLQMVWLVLLLFFIIRSVFVVRANKFPR